MDNTTRTIDNCNLYILGAELSGLSAAFHWPGNSNVYEEKETIGGAAASVSRNGFIYDYGSHVSFTTNKYVQNLFETAIGGRFYTHRVSNINFIAFPRRAWECDKTRP